jgi:hypothetical protein
MDQEAVPSMEYEETVTYDETMPELVSDSDDEYPASYAPPPEGRDWLELLEAQEEDLSKPAEVQDQTILEEPALEEYLGETASVDQSLPTSDIVKQIVEEAIQNAIRNTLPPILDQDVVLESMAEQKGDVSDQASRPPAEPESPKSTVMERSESDLENLNNEEKTLSPNVDKCYEPLLDRLEESHRESEITPPIEKPGLVGMVRSFLGRVFGVNCCA